MAKTYISDIITWLPHLKRVGIGIFCFAVCNAIFLPCILKTNVFVEMSSPEKVAVQIYYLDPFLAPDTYTPKALETKTYKFPNTFATLHFRLPASVKYSRLRFDFGNRPEEQFSLREIRIRRNYIFSYSISGENIDKIFTVRKQVANWKLTPYGVEWSSSGNDCYLISDSKSFRDHACKTILWSNLLLIALGELLFLLLSVCVGLWFSKILFIGEWGIRKCSEYFSIHPFQGVILSVLIHAVCKFFNKKSVQIVKADSHISD